jgi:hypothetical protein
MTVPNPKSIDATILKWSLLAGALYFACVALAHTVGFKVPGLFIYFNVPSHPYQDQIIGVLAFGWAALFYVASVDPINQPVPVKALLVASAAAILGFSRINALTDFSGFSPDTSTAVFWAQVAILFCYWVWLAVFFYRSRRGNAAGVTVT